jgi:hypothetical protein
MYPVPQYYPVHLDTPDSNKHTNPKIKHSSFRGFDW